MRLPTFIIAGAPRSGTTWLYEFLDRHPRIVMAKPRRPEPKFFLVDEEYGKGLAYYAERWFEAIPPDRCAGEKSTNYLESPVAAERIAKDIPEVKLLFALREPAARAYSNYRWSTMNGLETEDFGTALALEEQRAAECDEQHRYSRWFSYVERGLYALHLRRYLERFPREQLLVLRFEDLGDPDELARVHRFLEVEPRPMDAAGLGRVNAAEGEDTIDPRIMAALRERYREPNAELAQLLGPGFRGWETD